MEQSQSSSPNRSKDKDEDEIIMGEILDKTTAILHKLTPENFDERVVAFLGLNLEDKDDRIAAVSHAVFKNAIDEPMACASLVKEVCDSSQSFAPIFRQKIIDQCQKELANEGTTGLERQLSELSIFTAENDKKEEIKLELADKKCASRRRSLGNVRFIGELYELQVLTPKIIIDFVNILLENHDVLSFEAVCLLLKAIGHRLDDQLKELEMKAAAALHSNSNPSILIPTEVEFIPPEKYMEKTFEKLLVLNQDLKISSTLHSSFLEAMGECGMNPFDDVPKHIAEIHRHRFRQEQQEKNAPSTVIELRREEVNLHKAENAWKPTRVKNKTLEPRTEDENEIIMDEIVKKTRGILNKLTPENFDKLVVAFLGLNLADKDDRIAAVIHVLFEKAIDEPMYSTVYANMVKTVCDKSQLVAKKFRKNILDQCQKEFQKGSTFEKEIEGILEEELVTVEDDKKEEIKLEYEDKMYASKWRRLGNVRFIAELYKFQMLTPKITIDCVNTLLANRDENSLESLCILLKTIGQRLDNQLKELEIKAALALRSNPPTIVKFIPPEKYMDKTFENLMVLNQDMDISSRIRFALLDVIELRECGWKPRRVAECPMKIGKLRRDIIRQQQEEKIQLQNLPPLVPPLPGSRPQRKIHKWNTVLPNKPTVFQVKKPTGLYSENIVQALPASSTKNPAPIDIGESVKNIFEEFMNASNWDDIVYYMKENFPGDKVFDFVDHLSRQVSEMSKEIHEIGAGVLVKGLIERNLISKAEVIKVLTEGVMMELPDIEVDVPRVTSYLGVFLAEIFMDEPDLSWLVLLGKIIEEQEPTIWANLVTNTLNFLNLRLSEVKVQALYKKTEHGNRLPVDELPSIVVESVETLSKKMILVLENEKDTAKISKSFKKNSWDNRDELTSKSLMEAICQISWKAKVKGGWDIPMLQNLLPQLITAPKLYPHLWDQAKEFFRRNSIPSEVTFTLWEEMHKLKLTSRESVGHSKYW